MHHEPSKGAFVTTRELWLRANASAHRSYIRYFLISFLNYIIPSGIFTGFPDYICRRNYKESKFQ
jgi:hypothetical protein